DLIRGTVKFDSKEIDDFVILKADGFPTYNFAVTIDDYEMGISHVIRGDDHLTNTPKQALIYEALNFKKPVFAHVSMILGEDKAKLSKRHGATSVIEYKKSGYLPEAVLNYLVRLGWSYGNQEIFTISELIERFNLSNIGKSPSIFNPEKFLWVNSWYIKNSQAEKIAEMIVPILKSKGYEVEPNNTVTKIVLQFQERAETLIDLVDQSCYFFKDDFEYDEDAKGKFLIKENIYIFEKVIEKLSNLKDFTHDTIHESFGKVIEETELKLGKIAQPVRVAITGGAKSPGIFEVIEILGKEKTVRRLKKAIKLCTQ
ncbi:MAG: glutamate--tRNA ligase, partial [Thermodesulfobacteriota bacterium]